MLAEYSLDRPSLYREKVPGSDAEKIYRGLYVHSLGFYQMLHSLFAQSSSKTTMVSRIWKVFSLLLEHGCDSQYKSMLSIMVEENMRQMEELRQTLNEQKEKVQEEVDSLKRENFNLVN